MPKHAKQYQMSSASSAQHATASLRRHERLLAKERECVRRALEVYKIRHRTGALPAARGHERRLRTFVENYKNVRLGKRTGAVYASVNEILKRCMPGFEETRCNNEEGSGFASATGSSSRRHEVSAVKQQRLDAWCECYRQFGRWPSLPCYRDTQTAWDENPVLSRMPVATLVNSFKNYKQTVKNNGSGMIENAAITERLQSLDPHIFSKRYNKKTTTTRGMDLAAATRVPLCIQRLPDLTDRKRNASAARLPDDARRAGKRRPAQ